MKILHFTLKPKVPKTQIMEQFKKGAPAFAAIKGLKWKIWIEDSEDDTIGGLYYFKDDADLAEYKKSDMYKGTCNHPNWDVVNENTYNILEEFSKVTRAPL